MKKNKTIDLILCALFSALICIGAFIKIPTPLVPLTFQSLFTSLAGLLLGAKSGCLSVCIYIAMGLIGLPVFTQGGGITYILKPTFGYLIGYAIGTYVTGKISNNSDVPSFKRLLCANLAGMFFVYFIGGIYCILISKLYLKNNLGIGALLISSILLPIPGDILTYIISAAAAKKIIPIKNKYINNNTNNI